MTSARRAGMARRFFDPALSRTPGMREGLFGAFFGVVYTAVTALQVPLVTELLPRQAGIL
jgi:hypothetical protein